MKFQSRTLVQSPIEYGLCLSEADFVRTLKKLGMPHVNQPSFCSPRAGATTHFFEGIANSPDVIIVAMPDKGCRTIPDIHALLVHEAVHVWQHIKGQLGETCSIQEGYEFEAYSIQSIAYNLMVEYEDYELKSFKAGMKAKEKAKQAKKASKKAKKQELEA